MISVGERVGWARAGAGADFAATPRGREGWINTVRWRKSSASATGTNTCIEVGCLGEGFAVRDSTDPTGPVLLFSSFEWSAFATAVRHGAI